MRTTIRAAAVALGVLGLAGCGSGSGGYGGSAGSGSSSGGSSAASGAALATSDSSLGTVVVDGHGRTVYVFDKDTAGSGKSACTGACVANWPAVTADSATPAADGLSGKVGTITLSDGTKQVTLDGLPLYTFAADSHAGDVKGEGVKGIWWAVAPDGTKITQSASSAPPSVSGY
jgi:predicted lipoprotein with Yx(FWY)xxD motif